MPKAMKERLPAQKCIICKKVFRGYGNNAEPIADGECCNDCNLRVVVSARIEQIYGAQRERSK